jgi:hypothetical protein
VGETGKSIKVGEMVVAQEDGWRKNRDSTHGPLQGVLSAIAFHENAGL